MSEGRAVRVDSHMRSPSKPSVSLGLTAARGLTLGGDGDILGDEDRESLLGGDGEQRRVGPGEPPTGLVPETTQRCNTVVHRF
jgi:hypothetical protein